MIAPVLAALTALTQAHAEPAGTYTLAMSETQRAEVIEAAVTKSSDAYALWIRSVVHSKLAEVPTWCTTYTFTFDAEQIGWACDKQRPLMVSREQLGTTFTIRHQGKRFPTRITWTDPKITARFEGKEGLRAETFVFDPATGKLSVSVSIESPELLVPLRWTLTYAQARTASP